MDEIENQPEFNFDLQHIHVIVINQAACSAATLFLFWSACLLFVCLLLFFIHPLLFFSYV